MDGEIVDDSEQLASLATLCHDLQLNFLAQLFGFFYRLMMESFQPFFSLDKRVEALNEIIEDLLNVVCKRLDALDIFVHFGAGLFKPRSQVFVSPSQLFELVSDRILKLVIVFWSLTWC